jgi:hypothetical protein
MCQSWTSFPDDFCVTNDPIITDDFWVPCFSRELVSLMISVSLVTCCCYPCTSCEPVSLTISVSPITKLSLMNSKFHASVMNLFRWWFLSHQRLCCCLQILRSMCQRWTSFVDNFYVTSDPVVANEFWAPCVSRKPVSLTISVSVATQLLLMNFKFHALAMN